MTPPRACAGDMNGLCDLRDCPHPAVWVDVGEAGDLHICAEHLAKALDAWRRRAKRAEEAARIAHESYHGSVSYRERMALELGCPLCTALSERDDRR